MDPCSALKETWAFLSTCTLKTLGFQDPRGPPAPRCRDKGHPSVWTEFFTSRVPGKVWILTQPFSLRQTEAHNRTKQRVLSGCVRSGGPQCPPPPRRALGHKITPHLEFRPETKLDPGRAAPRTEAVPGERTRPTLYLPPAAGWREGGEGGAPGSPHPQPFRSWARPPGQHIAACWPRTRSKEPTTHPGRGRLARLEKNK